MKAAQETRQTPIARTVPGGIAPLIELTGVGPARARAFSRMGVTDVRDLLLLVPRRLATAGPRATIAAACSAVGREVTVAGRVARIALQRFGRRSTLRITVDDDSGSIVALFFNQPWLRRRFQVGEEIELRGRVVDARGPALASPKLGSKEKPLSAPGALTPHYPLTDGLGQELVRRLCADAARAHADRIAEPLAAADLARLSLPPLPRAVAEVHAPSSATAFEAARRRLSLEPFLKLQAQVAARRRVRLESSGLPCPLDDRAHARILAALPFVPTAGQARIAGELRADLARVAPMRRLLQGDVGSGKTALGLYACIAVASAGGQAAFLAPTELLAEQHFDGSRKLLERAGLHAVLLTGSLPSGERRAAIAQLASGMADVAFGTHALFSDDVAYRRLALAVIDEQQRFGVAQRARLLERGKDVHALLMTATPIPRTLAWTLYGDLDVSVLREAPPGRGRVRTRWVRGAERRRVQPFLMERLRAGEQVYFVSPRIGEAEADVEATVESGEGSAEAARERLSRTPAAEFGIELVHGRIESAERAQRLERFRRGTSKLLVATTVIEVGVDVPAATVMVIENAERLGLAQLHQLRGRIGRGPKDSWCLLFGKPVAAERFQFLQKTNDGFEIAEEDLRQRGMGELAGLRQAGETSEAAADSGGDLDLLVAARDLAATRPELAALYATESGSPVAP
ncbi:MAG TPA: ATP-dependent DNA helicase RecG [Planctomycetota bacterium]|jgi:ATP-dependent DNA helicase RecG|nr:ATP-dependent DNA helicase RecG [Planctomycetota bacterium]